MSLETTASSAKKDTRSLRATIPEGIVVFLGLKDGDKLEWNMKIIDGKATALVKKGKKN
jgi:hypothetical protein